MMDSDLDDSSEEHVMPLKENDITQVSYHFMKSGNSENGVLITHGTYKMHHRQNISRDGKTIW